MLPSEPEIAIDNLFVKGSEMADLMRARNWSQTPLGEPSSWSSSLKTVLSILLSSQHPIFLWWGEELIQFYNDAYCPILGTTKHPQALGQPGRECWQEIWGVIEPTIEAVMQRGEATRIQDGLLMLERNGYLEECYFNYAYSPVRNEAGEVGGVFCVCDETTKRVVGERQFKTLRELAAPVETKTVEAACQLCMSALSQNPADIPFALLYTIDDLGESGRLMGTAGIALGTIASPEQIDLATHPWNLYQSLRTAQAQYITDLTIRFEVLPDPIWNVPPQSAIVLPLARSGQQQIAGFLILAISPHRAFDDDYRGFFEVVANQVETAIANARAQQEERKQAEALAAIESAKTEFLSNNVSHEFRTPLTLMLSPLAETLANLDGSLPIQERERLQLVQRNGNRLLKLVNSLDNREALQQPTDTATDLDRIVSSFRDGFATFDRQWRYTYINDRLLKFLDLPREAVIGQYSWQVFPHSVGIKFYDRLNRAMNEQVEEQFEFYYSVADCWVEHRIYPTTDGIAMLMADISDRKRAELLLVEQKRLMELTAAGEPMDVCLAAVCASVSNLGLGDIAACILPTDAQRQQFPRSSPEFPPSFVLGLEDMPLDELEIGICAPAVYSGRSVTCADIVNDELQSRSWRDLCAANGILACHCAPILGADDVPLGSLMLCFDRPRVPTHWEYQVAEFGTQIASIVFERDRSSLALRESEAEYRTLFESIDEGFCIVKMIFDEANNPVDYRFVRANPAFVRLTGLPTDALGKTARELLPDLEAFWFEMYGKVALTGEAMRFEHKSELMSRWFDVYASRVGDATSRYVAIVFNNITDRQQAEEALRESEERFRNMADNAPMMVWVTDPTGYCTYLSRSWYEFSGQSESDGLGFGWLDATHPGDREFARSIFLDANERHKSFQLEYRLLRQDGEYRTCIDVGRPWFDADGEFRGYIGSVIDIDERKQVEATLAERARELANLNTLLAQAATLLDERNQDLDRFVHIVAHDLKAPLRAIANLSEWIEEDLEGSLTPDTQQQMDRLRGRVRLMESTISGLLDYARAGRTDATVETVSVAKLLAETIDILAPPPTFEMTIAPGMPTLQTKRLLLSQVFANLIGNAFKHHDRSDGSIRISSRQQGDFYEFAIADDGPGIAPADRDRVFVIFQAANPQKNPDSSGIGLAIVKKIVETAGGTIRLESELGQGTTFYFTWPDRS